MLRHIALSILWLIPMAVGPAMAQSAPDLGEMLFTCDGACLGELSIQTRSAEEIRHAAEELMWFGRGDLAEALITRRAASFSEAETLLTLSDALLQRGRVGQAQSVLREALTLLPLAPVRSRLENRERLLGRADELHHRVGIYSRQGRLVLFKFDPFLLNPPAVLDLQSGQELWLRSNADSTFSVIGQDRAEVSFANSRLVLTQNGSHAAYEHVPMVIEIASIRLRDGAAVVGDLLRPQTHSSTLVILTHGAGKADRANLYFEALNIVAAGAAAFVYDKPGLGASTDGNWLTLSLAQQVDIVTQAARQLRSRYGFTSVGVWGFSQGGWVAPMAATSSQAFSFVVMASASGLSPEEQDLSARREAYRASGAEAAALSSFTDFHRRVFSAINADAPLASFATFRDEAAHQPWATRAWTPQFSAEATWWRENQVQPSNYLPRLTGPVLVLLAGNDQSVVPNDNMAPLVTALARSGAIVQLNVIPGATHTFETSDSVFAPAYFAVQRAWIAQHVQLSPG